MTIEDAARRRRSMRLQEHDYASKAGYFVTLCTRKRACLFGEVSSGRMLRNALGEIVNEEWFKSAVIRPGLRLFAEEFVVMPNHVHGIIWIADAAGARTTRATHRVAPTDASNRSPRLRSATIGAIHAQFKSLTTKRINAHRGTPGISVWQRNYYEHIVRAGESLDRIRNYIIENPLRWESDEENPLAVRPSATTPRS